MAHELAMVNGKASMVYTGGTPWHGLGTKFPGLLTPDEAFAQSGQNYRVGKVDLYAHLMKAIPNGVVMEAVKLPGRFGMMRLDNLHLFERTAVGKSYCIVQNEQLKSALKSVMGTDCACVETAGVLRDGARVWQLARIDGVMRVGGDDVLNKYLLATNDHTGRMRFTMALTTVRVVCANTLSVALGSKESSLYRIFHRGNISARVNKAAEALGLVNKEFAELEEKMKALAGRKVGSEKEVDLFLAKLGFSTEDATQAQQERALTIKHSFVAGPGANLSTAKGTWWGLVNAVTDSVDHHFVSRAMDTDPGKRFEYAMYGAGQSLKSEAFNTALAMSK